MTRTLTLNKIRISLLASLLTLISVGIQAQQDAMFTKYMFNSLSFNPGYAGSTDYMSVVILHRDHWYGINGGPTTQTFTIHSPYNDKVGLGLAVTNDEIGATASTTANASYAYKIPFGSGTMSIGLQAGVRNFRTDWSKLAFKDPQIGDEAFDEDLVNNWLPNFGVGLYFHAPKYYIGFSVPHLIDYDLRSTEIEDPNLSKRIAKYYRHYFFHAGMAIPIQARTVVFKPSILFKSVNLFGEFSSKKNLQNTVAAPDEIDIDLSFYFYETFWIGAAFRSSIETLFKGGTGGNAFRSSVDSADIWMSVTLKNGLRIGAAYDFPLTQIASTAKGSYELMLGYDFNYQAKKINTPRYF